MSFENAERNLKEFLDDLDLEGFQFDENHTCMFIVDNQYSLHVTYEPTRDNLILYAPILDELPSDDRIKNLLWQMLLEGSVLGVRTAGASFALLPEENIVIIQYNLDMREAHASALKDIAPTFIAAVQQWREVARYICEEGSAYAAGGSSGAAKSNSGPTIKI